LFPMDSENKYLRLISASPNPGITIQISELQISKVGCPIRKFTDQSLFAAPHDLSQRTTSFIASQRQGIHRIPLRHLIALIIDAHRSAAESLPSVPEGKPKGSIIKDQFASNTPEDVAVMRRPLTEALARRKECRRNRMYFLFTMVDNPRSVRIRKTPRARKRNLILGRCLGIARDCQEPRVAKNEGLAAAVWWSQTESNRRPHACKARALPTELWPLSRRSAKRSNPRMLSVDPWSFDAKMVGLGRLELPTSRLSSARSNQLSYKPQAQASPCAKPARAA
jgi:hypothetical protein